MSKRILIIQGHPDAAKARFCRVLAERYMRGARHAGHEIRSIDVQDLEFPFLRTKNDFEERTAPPVIQAAQRDVVWANHVVIIYPLWLGDVPAILKAFLEQLFRPGFAFKPALKAGLPEKLLNGRSARIVVTMGMPAVFYRWYFGAHGLKNLKRNILGFCGFSPIAESVIGTIENKNGAGRERWLRKMESFGQAGV
jgi:putative NADPH-quinone reductase